MAETQHAPLPDAYPPAAIYDGLLRHPLHERMRRFADEFRARNADALSDYARQWVADPLHHWSRRWEYPYVFEQLERFAAEREGDEGLRILDAGSGLTFFPHFVARKLPVAAIRCVDRDAAIARDAARLGPPASPKVSYATGDLSRLDAPDAAYDCAYCISVLEHCGSYEEIVAELARVLRPGGRLILTIDVSLDGRAEIPREEAERLVRLLAAQFEPLAPYPSLVGHVEAERVVTTGHAGRLDPSLLPWSRPSAGALLRRLANPATFPWRRALGRAFGGGAGAPSELTFFCMTWTRPDAAGAAR